MYNLRKPFLVLTLRQIKSVDKFNCLKLGFKVGKSVILCQQVVILNNIY